MTQAQDQSVSAQNITSPETVPCRKRLSYNAYSIGWVCALPKEQIAARVMLDEEHEPLPTPRNDHNVYTLGSIHNHNIVIACLPNIGTTSAATVATSMINTFPSIRFGLMVGIGGGIPNKVKLGDVVVSQPVANYHGVVQWDMGKLERGGLIHTGSLNRPPNTLLNALNQLKATHEMYGSKINEYLNDVERRYPRLAPDYTRCECLEDLLLASGKVDQSPAKAHLLFSVWRAIIATVAYLLGLWTLSPDEENKQPSEPSGGARIQREVRIHYGLIASGNQVIKDVQYRGFIDKAFGGHVLCLEMEAAGLMNDFPCVVIRGICDYADSTKDKTWQNYAAAVAAAYAKELLGCVHPSVIDTEVSARAILEKVERHTQETRDTLSIIQSQFNQTVGWQNLRIVQGALFDSHDNQHDECLPGTRTNLLNEVENWVESIDGKCIFWLNGIAGTGKSTIAQTLARKLDKKGELGASFFFKKGEADRATARYLISTIIGQLVKHYPKLAPGVLKVVKEKPDISFKSLQQQFNDLLLGPLLTLHSTKPTTVVVVIDALDECEQVDDIKLIIRLLPAVQQSQALRLRIFLTSRSELFIRLGFKENEHHQDLILHELPEPVTEHDIRLFLKNKLTQIWGHPSCLQCSLSPDWPGDDNFEKLVTTAVPLFIIAATICCFLGDEYKLPDERLKSILKDRAMVSRSDMKMIYQLVSDRHHASRSQNELIEILQDSYSIIGIIILLATPLSVRAPARLKGIPDKKIISQLQRFHSALNISANLEAPVHILRLSFQDYLSITTEKRSFIDNQEIHGEIASYCLRLMKAKLKENICELQSYGIQQEDIKLQIIKKYLTLDIQYACLFWLRHLEQSKDKISDSDIFSFLQKHLLHWLEVLALIGAISEALGLINILKSRVHFSPELADFLYDAERFIRQNSYIAGIAPLQLYRAGLVFAPNKSVTKKIFYKKVMHQIIDITAVEDSWNSNLQTLEGHSKVVGSVAFSPDGCILATGSTDHTIKLWNTATGIELRILTGHSNWIFSVVFSPDNHILATGSRDYTIKLWNTITGAEQYTLAGHSGPVYSVAFLPDSYLLATGSSDCTIKIWDTAKGVELCTLTGHSGPVYSVAYSPDGCILATGSSDCTIKLWDTARRVELCTLTGHSGLVRSVAFSPDGCILATGSSDCTIKLWSTAKGVEHSGPVRSAVATGSYDHTIKLCDIAAGFKQHTLTGHSSQVLSVAFSPDGRMLATGSRDSTIKLWKTATGVEQCTLTGHSGPVRSVAFSPLLDSHLLVTGSDDQTIKLWDIAKDVKQYTLNSHSGPVLSIAFSPNGRILATGSSDYTIKLWNTATGIELHTLTGHSRRVFLVVFSPDSCILATGSRDQTVKVWDTTTGIRRYTLSYSSPVRSIAFSPDGCILVTKSSDHQTIKLWDAATGVEQHMHIGHSRLLSSILNKPSFNSHLSIEDSWILLRGERVLWLPAGYRSFTCYAVKDNTVALGFRNGRCHVLHFNLL